MRDEGRSERYRCAVLGPLRVWAPGGAEVTPSGVLPRRLLALLVLRRGTVVSADAAVELLWPGGRPDNPAAALHNHVSRLRRVLPDVIESAGSGYCLAPGRIAVDTDELARILDAGESAAEILARWIGPAYPELDMVDEARAESARLEELRLRAHESEAIRDLDHGRTDGLAARLRTMVDEHPLREPLRAVLIDTLVVTGRPADALRVYDEFRRLLAEELGTEPSEQLRQRYQRLLVGDTAATAPAPLPMSVTALIGRAGLLVEVQTLIAEARLVTLTGPGGVGKTRLMLELGRGYTDRPVVWCELAGADAEGAVGAVAAALAIDVRPGIPLGDRLADVIGTSEMLLLLDNCEHVIEPIATLADLLLRRCPRLRLIATSRERLRVAGEQVRRVPPLAIGDRTSPAVELFIQRATSVTGGLRLDTAAERQIGVIVSRLDGLPLAIELAAARMYSHDVGEIAAGLDRQFDFLSAGYRTATRHGSLAAAVSWSVDLLDRPLREAFTSLSVFSGPFDVVAAAAVCGAELGPTADRLTELTERSLVQRVPGRRYAILETLRTFGRTERAGEVDHAGARHAAYFVDWVEMTGRELAHSATAISRIDDAITELQRALHWLLERGDPQRAARIVAALMDYGLLRLRPDVLGWSEAVMSADPHATGHLAAEVLAAASYARWMAGDLPGAYERADRALSVCDDPPYNAYGAYGVCDLFSGRFAESADWYHRAAVIPGRMSPNMDIATWIMLLGYAGDPTVDRRSAELVADIGGDASPTLAYALYCAGEAVIGTDQDRARELLDRAVRMAENTSCTFVTGVAGASLASLDVRSGRTADAAAAYPILIRGWQRAGMWSTQWVMARSIALLLDQLGRPEQAAVLDGAIRAATAEEPLGSDREVLDQLSQRLRAALGADGFDEARRVGASLDNVALIDYIMVALGPQP